MSSRPTRSVDAVSGSGASGGRGLVCGRGPVCSLDSPLAFVALPSGCPLYIPVGGNREGDCLVSVVLVHQTSTYPPSFKLLTFKRASFVRLRCFSAGQIVPDDIAPSTEFKRAVCIIASVNHATILPLKVEVCCHTLGLVSKRRERNAAAQRCICRQRASSTWFPKLAQAYLV
jgi:hypothetical protein